MLLKEVIIESFLKKFEREMIWPCQDLAKQKWYVYQDLQKWSCREQNWETEEEMGKHHSSGLICIPENDSEPRKIVTVGSIIDLCPLKPNRDKGIHDDDDAF